MSTIAVSAGRTTAPRSGARTVAAGGTSNAGAPARPTPVGGGQARMRLTRRGRVVLVGLGLALAAGAGSIASQAVAESPFAEQETTTVVVGPGDSLWTIAQGITAPGQDVRDVVSGLAQLNQLDDLGLRVGDELLLPVS